MTTRTVRWGTLLLVLSVLAAAMIGAVGVAAGAEPGDSLLHLVLPALALALGVVVLFAGHVSYPRVQNLRVYLAGYSVGIQSIVYALVRGFDHFFVDAVPAAPPGYAELMFVLAIMGAYAYSLLPAFPSFRATRITTWVLVAVQIACLITARFLPGAFGWLSVLVAEELVSVPVLVAATLSVAMLVINALLPAQSFFLRGAFSGLALLAGAAWVIPAVLGSFGHTVSRDLVAVLYAGSAPFFLSISILFHVLAKMDHRVSYDPLLQVYNREYANRILAEQSNFSTKPPFALMMIDLDHFKQVNDTHGHQAGDKVLFTIAQAVQKQIIPEGILCRYGGEELIAFFPGATGRDIVPLAKRLRETIEKTEVPWKRERITVTVSLGISDRRFARQPLGHVVQAADKALYIAKENGRNQVRFVRLKDPRKVPR